jgi:4a-hydroxytetrahydrobiopterin dehydratase
MDEKEGPTRRRVPPAEADEKLKALAGWERDGETIRKTFKFPGFGDAVGFVARLAVIAASWDHHPDKVEIRYNKVKVVYSTHDAGGLTEMDFAVAESIEGRGEAI